MPPNALIFSLTLYHNYETYQNISNLSWAISARAGVGKRDKFNNGERGAAGRGAQSPPRESSASEHRAVVPVMCHAVVLGVLFSLPSYLYSAVPFR